MCLVVLLFSTTVLMLRLQAHGWVFSCWQWLHALCQTTADEWERRMIWTKSVAHLLWSSFWKPGWLIIRICQSKVGFGCPTGHVPFTDGIVFDVLCIYWHPRFRLIYSWEIEVTSKERTGNSSITISGDACMLCILTSCDLSRTPTKVRS